MKDCLLTIVFPAALKENVLDELLAHPEWGRGFTCLDVEGHGSAVPLKDSAEEVRGRSDQAMVQIAVSKSEATELLNALRCAVRSRHVAYWIAPLIDFGTFGSE